MDPSSTSGSSSIFRDGKLKSGVYKVQNIYTETFLDIEVHSRGVCCRPANDLGEGRGLWEIKSFGAGYTVQMVEPGKPEQFCTLMEGLKQSPLSVTAYPAAWRVEVADDSKHRGFEYIRLFWGTTDLAWDLGGGETGPTVIVWPNTDLTPWRIWRLVPMKVEGVLAPSRSSSGMPVSGLPPSYDRDATGGSPTRAQRTDFERDDFGTIVTEVTTVTTRKRYRIEDV